MSTTIRITTPTGPGRSHRANIVPLVAGDDHHWAGPVGVNVDLAEIDLPEGWRVAESRVGLDEVFDNRSLAVELAEGRGDVVLAYQRDPETLDLSDEPTGTMAMRNRRPAESANA